MSKWKYTDSTNTIAGIIYPDGSFTSCLALTLPEDTEIEAADVLPVTREELKNKRTQAVADIQVTITSGKIFNGDETSQNRMARAIIALQATNTATLTWVLADNASSEVTLAELVEALAMAGVEQSKLWVIKTEV